MKPYTAVTALEWAPAPYNDNGGRRVNEDDMTYTREALIFSMTDGLIKTFVVEPNGHVTPVDQHVEINAGIISSISWKDNLIVAGDTLGTLYTYNLKTKRSTNFSTGKGLVRKIRFSPSNSHSVLVLFNEEFGVWDLDHT